MLRLAIAVTVDAVATDARVLHVHWLTAPATCVGVRVTVALVANLPWVSGWLVAVPARRTNVGTRIRPVVLVVVCHAMDVTMAQGLSQGVGADGGSANICPLIATTIARTSDL